MAALLATICTGLFAGAAIYINLVEHPARMSLGARAAVAEFQPSYARAAVMQASLAIVGCAASVWAWAGGEGEIWLVAATLIGSVVPFTLLVVRSVNDRLLELPTDRDSPEAPTLLARWGRLHAVRSTASLAAFILDIGLLLRA